MDLSIARVRQISAAITERKMKEERKNQSLLSWQTKLICSFIAHTVPVEEGQENPLAKAAETITLDPRELTSAGKSDDINTKRPEQYADSNALALFARGLGGGPVSAS